MLEALDAAVIGGGISGLTAAHALAAAGRSVALVEASRVLGGRIGSVRSGSYVADMGPQTFVMTPALRELVAELGISDRFIAAPPGLKRYVLQRGKLVALPMSPAQLIASPLLSLGAKLSLAREAFIPPAQSNEDESIASFVRRRAGPELLDAIVAPLVSGIYAGDPERLSMRSTFPRTAEFERLHGSVIRGFLARSGGFTVAARSLSAPGAPPRLQSGGFADGNQTLIDALVARLGPSAYTNARVVALRQRGAGFMLECEGLPEGKIEAASVIVATSPERAAELVRHFEPGAAEDMQGIESPPLAQVVLAYPKASIGVPLDGFGFLARRGEDVRVLGAVWNSIVLPGRCPESEVLITVFLGGATDPGIQQCTDEDVATIAHRDLARVMRISRARPTVVAGFRWTNAIPQYTLGHDQRIARIRAAIDRVPNLYLIGNFLTGVSVADCISLARTAATKVASKTKGS